MRLLPALAAAAATAAIPLVAAGPAAAQSNVRLFKVTAEGSGTFKAQQLVESLPGLPSEINDSVEYAWKVQLPSVAFLPTGEAILTGDQSGAIKGTLTGKASHETVLRGLDGQGNVVVTRGTCTAAPQTQPVVSASVTPAGVGEEHGEPGGYLEVVPHQNPGFAATCEGPLHPPTSQLTVAAAAGAMRQKFFLPSAATQMGKVIQLVHAGPGQKDSCFVPGLNVCAFDWSGKLTFEFAGYLETPPEHGGVTEDDIPMPIPAPVPSAPAPEPDPDPMDDLILPIPPKAKVDPKGRSASVRVRCRAACSGIVRAFSARGAKGAAAAATKSLATARFSAGDGETVRVRLRFAGKARRVVRRAGAVRLVIAAGGDRRTVIAS